ncbi:hypothetical protein BgiBS90_002535 [Biomphalaria glabrata]|nr:hypothetical protein BgiBS90_002535 [Biomphalaria glabrata]
MRKYIPIVNLSQRQTTQLKGSLCHVNLHIPVSSLAYTVTDSLCHINLHIPVSSLAYTVTGSLCHINLHIPVSSLVYTVRGSRSMSLSILSGCPKNGYLPKPPGMFSSRRNGPFTVTHFLARTTSQNH